MYSELIRLDIPRPSSVNPSRPPTLRPSLPFVMKPSCEGPSVVKPTQEELQARVESLAKKKRSVKRKVKAPPESSLAIRGKILRMGASSPPLTAKELGSSDQVLARGQAPPSMVEVSKVAGQKNPSGRSAEPPLEVLPISIRSPSTQNTKLPPTTSEDEGRDGFGTEGDEDSLLTNSNSPSRLYCPSYEILTSRGRMPSPLRRLWPYRFRERSPYVRKPLFVRSTVVSNYPLILSLFCRWLPI